MPRARTISVEGPCAVWDPANPEAFTVRAGSQFIRAEGDTARVRTRNGGEIPVYPGWVVITPDGSGDGEAVFATPEAVDAATG